MKQTDLENNDLIRETKIALIPVVGFQVKHSGNDFKNFANLISLDLVPHEDFYFFDQI